MLTRQHVSAYHVGRDEEQQAYSTTARALILQLPLHFKHEATHGSMPFSELAFALDALGRSTAKAEQREILKQLFGKARSTGKLEMYLLLKMLLPSYDNECVYGMKTRRLMHVVGDALRKLGRSDANAILKQWFKNVPLQNSLLAKGRGIVCLPELAIATQCTRAASLSSSPPTTLVHVGVVCRMLTTAYLSPQSSQQQLETAQSEIMRQVIEEGGLSFQEWLTLTRILLKKVSMGVGVKTVLSALPVGAKECFDRQRDLAVLAEACMSEAGAVSAVVVCGVPFCPMTCHNLRSPYLMRWLFGGSQGTVGGKQIGAKDNQMVLKTDGEWFVTVTNANAKERLFVNLNGDRAVSRATTKKRQVILLREFQKAGMLAAPAAKGKIVHYRLVVENRGPASDEIVRLLLLKTSKRTGADRMAYNEAWERAHRDSGDDDDDELAELIAKPEVQVGKRTLQVSVANHNNSSNAPPKPSAKVAPKRTGGGVRTRSQVVVTPADMRKQKKPAAADGEAADKPPSQMMLMVQQKLDGDRIQVHIMSRSGDAKKKVVKLFTKWGKDVTDLYSNVCDDLTNVYERHGLDKHAPCVLDGELIVVDRETGEAMPWSSTKWRYNDKSSQPLQSLMKHHHADDDDAVIALTYDEGEDGHGTLNNMADEEAADELTFVSQRGLKKCEAGLRGRVVDKGMLQVVLYDIIVHQGKAVHEMGCQTRFALLRKELQPLLKSRSKHCRVLEATHDLNTLERLMQVLEETVHKGHEGLVLKDPRARYDFGKSEAMHKLKLTGPEINVGVVGVGSSLSSNPRMCGLLTCIMWKQGTVMSYCRVEILEGDKPWKATEHVMSDLHSRVSVAELEAGMKAGGKPVKLPKYSVLMVSSPGNMRKVTWRPVAEEDMQYECELLIMPGDLADVQWLVSPYECLFGLSVHGDLRPLVTTEEEEAVDLSGIWKPRNAVGRIELRGYQMSNLDTRESIKQKFEGALDSKTCVQSHMFRRIAELRSMSAKKARLVEIARVLESHLESGSDMPWPQPEPKDNPTIEGMNLLLKKTAELAPSELVIKSITLKELSPEERLALYNYEGESQWETWKKKLGTAGAARKLESTEDATDAAQRQVDLSKALARFRELSARVMRPVMYQSAHVAVGGKKKSKGVPLHAVDTSSAFEAMQEEYQKKYVDEDDAEEEEEDYSDDEDNIMDEEPYLDDEEGGCPKVVSETGIPTPKSGSVMFGPSYYGETSHYYT